MLRCFLAGAPQWLRTEALVLKLNVFFRGVCTSPSMLRFWLLLALLCAAEALVPQPTELSVTLPADTNEPPVLRWQATGMECASAGGSGPLPFQQWRASWRYAAGGSTMQSWGVASEPFPTEIIGVQVPFNAASPSVVVELTLVCGMHHPETSAPVSISYSLATVLSVPSAPVADWLPERVPYGAGWALLRLYRPTYTCEDIAVGGVSGNLKIQAAAVPYLYERSSINLPDAAFSDVAAVPFFGAALQTVNVSNLAASQTYVFRSRLQCVIPAVSSPWAISTGRTGMHEVAALASHGHGLEFNRTSPPRFGTLFDRGVQSLVVRLVEPFVACDVWADMAQTSVEMRLTVGPNQTVDVPCMTAPQSHGPGGSTVREYLCAASGLAADTEYPAEVRTVCMSADGSSHLHGLESHWVRYRSMPSLRTLPRLNDFVTAVSIVQGSNLPLHQESGEEMLLSAVVQTGQTPLADPFAPETRSRQFVMIETNSTMFVFGSKMNFFFFQEHHGHHVFDANTTCDSVLAAMRGSGADRMLIFEAVAAGVHGTTYYVPYAFPEPGLWSMCVFTVADDFTSAFSPVPRNMSDWVFTVPANVGTVSVQYDGVLTPTSVSIERIPFDPAAGMLLRLHDDISPEGDECLSSYGVPFAFVEVQVFGYASESDLAAGLRSWVDVSPLICSSEMWRSIVGHDLRMHGGFFVTQDCAITRASVRMIAMFARLYDKRYATTGVGLWLQARRICSNGNAAPWADRIAFSLPLVASPPMVDPASAAMATTGSISLLLSALHFRSNFTVGCEDLATSFQSFQIEYAFVGHLGSIILQSTEERVTMGGGLDFDGVPLVPALETAWVSLPPVSGQWEVQFIQIPGLNDSSLYAVRARTRCFKSPVDEIDRSSEYGYIGTFPTRTRVAHNPPKLFTQPPLRTPSSVIADSHLGDWGCAWAGDSATSLNVSFADIPWMDFMQHRHVAINQTGLGFVFRRPDTGGHDHRHQHDRGHHGHFPGGHDGYMGYFGEQVERSVAIVAGIAPMQGGEPVRPGSFVAIKSQQTCSSSSVRSVPPMWPVIAQTRHLDGFIVDSIMPTTVVAQSLNLITMFLRDTSDGDFYEVFFSLLASTPQAACKNISDPLAIRGFTPSGSMLFDAVPTYFSSPGTYVLCLKSASNRDWTFRAGPGTVDDGGFNLFVPVGFPRTLTLTVLPAETQTPTTIPSPTLLTALSPSTVSTAGIYVPSAFAATLSAPLSAPLVVIPVFVPSRRPFPGASATGSVKLPEGTVMTAVPFQASCKGVSLIANSLRDQYLLNGFFVLEAPAMEGTIYFCTAYQKATAAESYQDSDFSLQQSVPLAVAHQWASFLPENPLQLVYSPGSYMHVTWSAQDFNTSALHGAVHFGSPVLIGLRPQFAVMEQHELDVFNPGSFATFTRTFIVSAGSLLDEFATVRLGFEQAWLLLPEVIDHATDICLTVAVRGIGHTFDRCGLSVFASTSCGSQCVEAQFQSVSGVAMQAPSGAAVSLPPFSIPNLPWNGTMPVRLSAVATSPTTPLPSINGVALPSPPAVVEIVEPRSGKTMLRSPLAAASELVGIYPLGQHLLNIGGNGSFGIPVPLLSIPVDVSVIDASPVVLRYNVLDGWSVVPPAWHGWHNHTHPGVLASSAGATPSQVMFDVILPALDYYVVFTTTAPVAPNRPGGYSSSVNAAAVAVPIVLVAVAGAAVGGYVWHRKRGGRSISSFFRRTPAAETEGVVASEAGRPSYHSL